MTDTEINIAIAEQCGYGWYARWTGERGLHEKYATFSLKPEDHGLPGMVGRAGETFKITEHESALLFRREFLHPNYCNDLNAMHEAEKILEVGHDGSPAADYQEALYGIANPGRNFIEDFCNGADVAFLHNLIHSTARQRAEAFLKTFGTWKD